MKPAAGTRLGRDASTWWAAPLAIALAIVTFVHLGGGANAAAWAVAQIVLVVLAAYDLAERRLPNAITIPGAAAALVLRALFVRSELLEVAFAGAVAFAVFLVLTIVLRGAIGMGDVKLAGLLGFMLGGAVVQTLVLGVVAGGVASVALLAARRITLRSSIAYGPYLALGGAIGVLAFNPPSLV